MIIRSAALTFPSIFNSQCAQMITVYIEVLFQNVRSLHLHFALCSSNDSNDLYQIPSFQLLRNDFMTHGTRTPYGTNIYVNVQLLSEPLRCNYNDIEMTLIRVNQPVHNLHIVAIYRSTSRGISVTKMLSSTMKNNHLVHMSASVMLYSVSVSTNHGQQNIIQYHTLAWCREGEPFHLFCCRFC